jgi:hypothetical protein
MKLSAIGFLTNIFLCYLNNVDIPTFRGTLSADSSEFFLLMYRIIAVALYLQPMQLSRARKPTQYVQENTEYVPDFLFARFHPLSPSLSPTPPALSPPSRGKRFLGGAWPQLKHTHHYTGRQSSAQRLEIANTVYTGLSYIHIYIHTQLCIIQFRANYKTLQDTARRILSDLIRKGDMSST